LKRDYFNQPLEDLYIHTRASNDVIDKYNLILMEKRHVARNCVSRKYIHQYIFFKSLY
jgi:hypothetical protein